MCLSLEKRRDFLYHSRRSLKKERPNPTYCNHNLTSQEAMQSSHHHHYQSQSEHKPQSTHTIIQGDSQKHNSIILFNCQRSLSPTQIATQHSMLSFDRHRPISTPEATMTSTAVSSSASDLNEKTLSYLALILNTIESKDWMVRVPTSILYFSLNYLNRIANHLFSSTIVLLPDRPIKTNYVQSDGEDYSTR